MRNNNLKQIVQQIKKMAVPLDLDGQTAPAATPATSSPKRDRFDSPIPSETQSNSVPAGYLEIKTMQKTIQKVGEVVKSSSPEFQGFMFKQYGVNLGGNNFSNIGTGKNGVVPDGVWGKRTQQSLSSIIKLSESLLKVSQEFGGTTRKSWSAGDHNSLTKLIAVQDNKSKVKNAPTISELLNKLADFYTNYARQVAQTSTFKKISNPNGVIFSVGNPAPGNLVDEKGKSLLSDPAFLSQRIDANLPSPTGNVLAKISLLDMFDKNRFQKFLQQSLKYDEAQSKSIQLQNTILSMIRQQVQPLIKSHMPEATPPTNPSEVM